MTAATLAINYGLSFVGTKETPPNSNRGPQIDKWQRAVGMLGEPWCGAGMYACLSAAGVKGLSSRMRYCPYIVQDASAGVNGLAHLVSWEEAQPGDLLLFQWDSGPVDHVGMLYAKAGQTARTIEFNTAVGNDSDGGEVMQRTRPRSVIAHIARPRWPAVTGVPLTPCEWPGITLKKGAKSPGVKVVQGWVNALEKAGYGYERLTVDGDFGPATEHEVKRYQQIHRLEPDGVVGPLTWRAMCSSVRSAA